MGLLRVRWRRWINMGLCSLVGWRTNVTLWLSFWKEARMEWHWILIRESMRWSCLKLGGGNGIHPNEQQQNRKWRGSKGLRFRWILLRIKMKFISVTDLDIFQPFPWTGKPKALSKKTIRDKAREWVCKDQKKRWCETISRTTKSNFVRKWGGFHMSLTFTVDCCINFW